MTITPKNLVKHEVIGLHAEVYRCTDPAKEGLKGKIVNESKNTITIQTKEKTVQIAKQESVFRFHLPSGVVEIHGSALIAKPDERTKTKIKK